MYTFSQVVLQALLEARSRVFSYAPQDTASTYVFFLYAAMAAARAQDHNDTTCHGVCVNQPYEPEHEL